MSLTVVFVFSLFIDAVVDSLLLKWRNIPLSFALAFLLQLLCALPSNILSEDRPAEQYQGKTAQSPQC